MKTFPFLLALSFTASSLLPGAISMDNHLYKKKYETFDIEKSSLFFTKATLSKSKDQALRSSQQKKSIVHMNHMPRVVQYSEIPNGFDFLRLHISCRINRFNTSINRWVNHSFKLGRHPSSLVTVRGILMTSTGHSGLRTSNSKPEAKSFSK